jgi:hypothetical protein
MSDLREQVASAYGLDADAAAFLVGTTLGELEASAEKLVELLDRSYLEEQEQGGMFDALATARVERKRELAMLFAGRSTPRDEQGRFVQRSGSFDGGARPGSLRRAESHDELIARLAIESRLHRSSSS